MANSVDLTELERDGVIYVDFDALGENDGSSWDNAYTDLQDALANATTGDEIWVAEGTYKPTDGQDRSLSFELKSGVAIYGGFTGAEETLEARDFENNQTILSGNLGIANDNSDNSYHVVNASNTNSEAILDGFLITAGNADGSGADDFNDGGGIYALQGQATFQNLIIFGNNAETEGGGFYSGDLSSLDEISRHQLTNVVFRNNTAGARGGGINNDDGVLILDDVEFLDNVSSTTGGGISNSGSIILTNGRFVGNSTNVSGGAIDGINLTLTDVEFINNSAEQGGGAIATGIRSSDNNYDLNNVSFINNTAEEGGAIYVSGNEDDILINTTRFEANSASELGGAIYVRGLFGTNPVITNSVFNGNDAPSGGAIYIDNNNATISNSTFANNEGGNGAGIFSLLEGAERPTVTNSIFYDNQGNAIANEGGTTVVTNSIVEGGYAGEGNLDSDPLFVDSANGDLRLVANSPGVDRGDNEVVDDSDPTNSPQDIAGNPRIFNNTVDLGAYEYSQPYIAIDNPQVEVNTTTGEPIEDTEAIFTVRITDSAGDAIANNSEITINYQTTNNTAVVEEDYLSSSGTLTFAPGENEKTVTVPVLSNTDTEESANFYLDLSDITGEDFIDIDSRGVATIINVSDSEPEPEELETLDLFRFRNKTYETGTYVFVDERERELILIDSDFSETFCLDGEQDDGTVNPAFTASVQPGEDLIPFYRLQSLEILGTFLFVSTEEYNAIFADDSDQQDKWEQQGFDEQGEDIPEFYLLDGSADRGIEFNRFQNNQNGTFLYAGEAETAAIESDPNLSSVFTNQGVAFKSLL